MAEILLIEDDLKLRAEIQKYLESKGHSVCCCDDAEDGFSTLQQMAFDVVILDIQLPGLQGTDLLRQIAQSLPCHPPLIVSTGHGDKQTAIKAVHFGAFDFIEKPFPPSALDETIGRALVERKQEILNFRTYVATASRMELTPREREVAFLASEGLSNDEIAQKLTLGPETVKSHLKKIFRKLGVANRTSLSHKLHK